MPVDKPPTTLTVGFLPGNQAWTLLLGDIPIEINDRTLWERKGDLIKAMHECGLGLNQDQTVYVIEEHAEDLRTENYDLFPSQEQPE